MDELELASVILHWLQEYSVRNIVDSNTPASGSDRLLQHMGELVTRPELLTSNLITHPVAPSILI
jgi:hypothetical protein